MRDPQATVERRVWTSCVACPDGSACADCRDGRNCDRHWRYLLGSERGQVFVQCPTCLHRWWHDTGFGAGGAASGPSAAA
jgi:hypothetical protein